MIVKYDEVYKDRLIALGKQYDESFENKFLSANNMIYLYIENEQILGFLIIEEVIDESNIILIYVDSNFRHRKVATSLLDYFISDLDPNKKRILLEVSSENKVAINMYQKFGFETINIRKKYYKDQTDALIMERMITGE